MNKKITSLLAFVTIFSMVGCNKNKELSGEELEEALTENFEVTKSNLKEVLSGNEVGIEFSAKIEEAITLTNGTETSSMVGDASMDFIVNLDLTAGQKYMDEYNSRVDYVADEEELASIAANDKTSTYAKLSSSTTTNGSSWSSIDELWDYPTETYYYENYDGEENRYYEENSLEYLYETYESVFAIKEVLDMSEEELNSVMDTSGYTVFIDFLNGDITSEELLTTLGADESLEAEEKQFLVNILDEIQTTDFNKLYNAKVETKDKISTYTISLNLEGIVAAIQNLVDTFEAEVEENADLFPAEVVSQINAIIAVVEKDLKENLPSKFDVSVSLSFNKNQMLVGFAEVCEVKGNVPDFVNLINPENEVTTYDYKINSSLNFDITDSYKSLPTLDKSKFEAVYNG